jgi:hypothetical protein
MDTLDQNLDASTFEYLSSSHDPIVQFSNNGIIRFSFPDINLPDSTSNEHESHGFVSYRVKTNPGLPVGTAISNTAYIYFDYNPAVITNTTLNTVTNFTQVPEHEAASISLYPNPASQEIMVTMNGINHTNFVLEFFDIYGNLVYEALFANNKHSGVEKIDVSGLSAGVYLVKIADHDFAVTKFVKF